jgi:hypothetical protein
MAYDPSQQQTVTVSSVIDVGLQDYMRGVFNTMAFGLGITGLTAFGVANIPALYHLIFGTPLAFVAMIAPLIFIWMGFKPARIARMPANKLRSSFFLFSAVMGISFAAVFHIFSGESIARAFFITAGTFAATSLYGYMTKRDLTAAGSFLMMGLIGMILAAVVNIFLHSSALQFVISIVGVLVFTGMTAFDVQRLKETYSSGAGEANAKVAIMGALSLYLNFINLFQIILSLSGGGDRRN